MYPGFDKHRKVIISCHSQLPNDYICESRIHKLASSFALQSAFNPLATSTACQSLPRSNMPSSLCLPTHSTSTTPSSMMQGGYRALFAEGKSRIEGETLIQSSQANASNVAKTPHSPTSSKSLTTRKWAVVKTVETSQKVPETPQYSKEMYPDSYLDFAAKHDKGGPPQQHDHEKNRRCCALCCWPR